MSYLKSIIIATSMFSRIPTPKMDWNAKNMRYIMAAFPLVGVAVGAAAFGWGVLCPALGLGAFLRGVGFLALSVAITGGIHIDGFCDTVDALSSRADRDKKLEILSDSHIGAFAAIGCGLYFLLYAALAAELDSSVSYMLCFSLTFVLSRALSGLAVVFFPCAKGSGLVRAFADASARKASGAILSVILLVCAALIVYFGGFAGLFALAGAFITFGIYHRVALKEFGGITGDTAGWFLQICEMAALAGIVLAQKLFLHIM